jgi:predicted MPP superfamily phosphohydrolase
VDLWSGEIDAQAAFRDLDAQRPAILLAHNPDSKDSLNGYPWNLMLSGHTHGGQVIVPFKGPCFAPVKDLRFIAGLKRWGTRHIFVNRGVGNLGGVRFDCRPEVSIVSVA